MGPQRDICCPAEGRIPGEQLAEHAAERVDVGRGCHNLPEALLRRHARRGADGPVDLRQAWQGCRAAQDGDAEVEHLHQAAVDEHHVGRLDVAVDDVDAVDVGEHGRDLCRDRRRPGQARRRGGVVRPVEHGFQG